MTPAVTVAVGAIVRDGDRLLLIRRGRPPEEGRWSLPGGQVESGEPLADAVRRELAEETGLVVKPTSVVDVVERHGPTHHFVIVDYLATVIGSNTVRAGDDAAAVEWVPPGTLASLELVDGLRDFLTEHGIVI